MRKLGQKKSPDRWAQLVGGRAEAASSGGFNKEGVVSRITTELLWLQSEVGRTMPPPPRRCPIPKWQKGIKVVIGIKDENLLTFTWGDYLGRADIIIRAFIRERRRWIRQNLQRWQNKDLALNMEGCGHEPSKGCGQPLKAGNNKIIYFLLKLP